MTEPLPEDVAAEKAALDRNAKWTPPKRDPNCTRFRPLLMVIYPPGARVSCPVHGWHWFGPNAGLTS